MTDHFRIGIDVGSTTVKVVVLDRVGEIAYSDYRRHRAETLETLQVALEGALQKLGNQPISLLVTGSAGLGLSERCGLAFIQEVVASAEYVRQRSPQVKTLIDIGGEDAKMIFFDANGRPDIRMNGFCAGGTGAFIDEMASLLNVTIPELNALAENHKQIYPIASRCGVFAKTDVQNLLSRDISREDIAASIFNAIVLQTLATLSRGNDPAPLLLMSGGPLTFLSALRAAFMGVLELKPSEVLNVEHGELLPAFGAALAESSNRQVLELAQLSDRLGGSREQPQNTQNRLRPLFVAQADYQDWKSSRAKGSLPRTTLRELQGEAVFLGVDSGSTTTKLVLIDAGGNVAFYDYRNNDGNSIRAVGSGLERLRQQLDQLDQPPRITRSVVTGYGEDLIRAAFGFDEGMVETLAHYKAASTLEENVSFILDIGGQDMKAIFIQDGHIRNIEINEACSSGCGSFIQNFAQSMGHSVDDFAQKACASQAPCDLGTRCTVFMNSRVKQALREGAEIEDISAGLAYSVIKNALHKVLKVTNTDVLGEHIVVQGGTFKNPAILKAIERLLEKEVMCPDLSEVMGAYGAALAARDRYLLVGEGGERFVGLESLDSAGDYHVKQINCRGCENRCAVSRLEFPNKNVFFTGNRCEKIYTNSGKRQRRGSSLPAIKNRLLFDRPTAPEGHEPLLTLGIPRVLNIYENYPFWNTLFMESGIQIRLSDPSSKAIYDKGAGTIMSENICYPAKLVHGHIYNLIEAGVDRIFFPMVFYEDNSFSDAFNCFVCPILSGYPDVIRSAIDPAGKHNIPLDKPTVNLNDTRLLRKACTQYLSDLGVPKQVIKHAFEKALVAQRAYKEAVRQAGEEILSRAREDDRPTVLMLSHPYHIDEQINHKIPDILINFGVDVITEDSVPLQPDETLDNRYAVTQWEYINRLYHACHWAGKQADIEVVQLNSFGCGPDAYAVDESRAILREYGKSHTVIRIDEVESTGSTRLRLRSMIEAYEQKQIKEASTYKPRKSTRVFQKSDFGKTVIVPQFANYYTYPLIRPAQDMGHEVVILPPPNRGSVEVGLKYANNEICYPGVILIGDILKALQSGKHDPDKTVVGLWETGGQCRASCIFAACKQALVSAGMEQVPVITVSTNTRTMNEQPDLGLDIKGYIYNGALAVTYSDAIMSMYYANLVREVHKGQTEALTAHYMELMHSGALPLKRKEIYKTLRQAVADYNLIETEPRDLPKVGILGEIYVKYNDFGNHGVVHWLRKQDVEVVIPPLLEGFTGWFVSVKAHVEAQLKRRDLLWLLSDPLYLHLQGILKNVDTLMQDFKFYKPQHSIKDVGRYAGELVSLTHQYGESWMIAGAVGALAHAGVHNVLCLQPFGCIANHVVAKGVQKLMKSAYPELNILFMDTDAGTSEVNFYNRMHFFINHARANHESSNGNGRSSEAVYKDREKITAP